MQEFPIDLRSVVPDGLPYSAWQVLKHMRRHNGTCLLDYDLQHLIGIPESSPKKLRCLETIGLGNKLLSETTAGNIRSEAFWKIGIALKH